MTRTQITEIFHELVVGELLQERAQAMGRAGAKVEEALAQCHRLLRRLDADRDGSGPADADLLAAYRSARKQAEQRIWELCVQRECLGLYEHARVDEVFPLPPMR
ncbi:MAG: hypothetical protein ACK5RL_04640 [Acidimicrobiales bacterium]